MRFYALCGVGLLAACQPVVTLPASPMLRSDPEPAGENCAAGGVVITSGMDQNDNQILDAEEVIGAPSYVCSAEELASGGSGINGANGSTGATGATGEAGPEGAPGATGATGATGVTGADGAAGALIPDGVWLDGVNAVSFYMNKSGLQIVHRDTTGVPGVSGSFNGTGTGNKALVGLWGYNGVPVSEIETLTVTAKNVRGDADFYLNMLIDFDGDGAFTAPTCNDNGTPADTSDDVTTGDCLVVLPSGAKGNEGFDLPTDGTDQTATIDFSSEEFFVVIPGSGGCKTHCGLPKLFEAQGAPLSALIAAAPPAAVGPPQIINAATGDGGMPRGTITAGILFVAGGSTTKTASQLEISNMSVARTGSDLAEFDFRAE